MGYYRGDYYRGDYYRGDVWRTLGNVAKIGAGFAFGGPMGGAAAAMTVFRPPQGAPSPPQTPTGGGYGGGLELPTIALPGGVRIGGGGLKAYVERPTGQLPVAQGAQPGATGMLPRGWHLNRSGYWTKGGVYHPPNSTLVRNRHMNVANVHALRRSARRAAGFIKISRRLVSHYVAKQPKGRPFIRRKKRAA